MTFGFDYWGHVSFNFIFQNGSQYKIYLKHLYTIYPSTYFDNRWTSQPKALWQFASLTDLSDMANFQS
jgi:hypothetical protein